MRPVFNLPVEEYDDSDDEVNYPSFVFPIRSGPPIERRIPIQEESHTTEDVSDDVTMAEDQAHEKEVVIDEDQAKNGSRKSVVNSEVIEKWLTRKQKHAFILKWYGNHIRDHTYPHFTIPNFQNRENPVEDAVPNQLASEDVDMNPIQKNSENSEDVNDEDVEIDDEEARTGEQEINSPTTSDGALETEKKNTLKIPEDLSDDDSEVNDKEARSGEEEMSCTKSFDAQETGTPEDVVLIQEEATVDEVDVNAPSYCHEDIRTTMQESLALMNNFRKEVAEIMAPKEMVEGSIEDEDVPQGDSTDSTSTQSNIIIPELENVADSQEISDNGRNSNERNSDDVTFDSGRIQDHEEAPEEAPENSRPLQVDQDVTNSKSPATEETVEDVHPAQNSRSGTSEEVTSSEDAQTSSEPVKEDEEMANEMLQWLQQFSLKNPEGFTSSLKNFGGFLPTQKVQKVFLKLPTDERGLSKKSKTRAHEEDEITSSDAPEDVRRDEVDKRAHRVIKKAKRMIEKHPEAYARAVENRPGFSEAHSSALKQFGVADGSRDKDLEELKRKWIEEGKAKTQTVIESVLNVSEAHVNAKEASLNHEKAMEDWRKHFESTLN